MFLKELAGPGSKLLIFDEIHKIKNWDPFIRTIYEREKDVEIILTGSNSELISEEPGSNLAGRFIERSILPFSFKEFLQYQGATVKNTKDFLKESEEISHLFNIYLKCGGLPEVLTINTETAKFSYLEGILSKVILDDIIRRFKVRQPVVIQQLLQYLLFGIGTIVSYIKIANRFKAEGAAIALLP